MPSLCREDETRFGNHHVPPIDSTDLSGEHRRFRILGAAQKSGRDELLRVTPDFAEWLLLMRHASIQTTMGYDVELDADEMATQLWATHSTPAAGNRIGNIEAPEAEKTHSRATVSPYPETSTGGGT